MNTFSPGKFTQAIREPDTQIIRKLVKLGLEKKAWTLRELKNHLGVGFSTVWKWATDEDKGQWEFFTTSELKALNKILQSKRLSQKDEEILRDLTSRLQ